MQRGGGARGWRGGGRGAFRARGEGGYRGRGGTGRGFPGGGRLNRPPWPRQLLQQPFPNSSRQPENFQNNVNYAEDDFRQQNFNQQTNFNNQPHNKFQRALVNEFQQGAADFPISKPTRQGFEQRAPPINVWEGTGPSEYSKDTLRPPVFQHCPQTFNQDSQFQQGPTNVPQGRANFQKQSAYAGPIWNQAACQTAQKDYERTSFRTGAPNFERNVSIFQKIPSLLERDYSNFVPNTAKDFSDVQSESQGRLHVQPGYIDFEQDEDFVQEQTDFQTDPQSREKSLPFSGLVLRSPPGFHRRKSGDSDYESQTLRKKSLLQTPDYSGHRPTATDHYGLTVTVHNDEAYNKSLGDTVDIIKKRLIDRQENPASLHRDEADHRSRSQSPVLVPEKVRKPHRRSSHRESTSHRSKSDRKCAKMKKKIVRQLFKMDKTALQKFVDDPQSSSKFECAVNCLITESRNSLNRQMRSAAEKSLCGSNSVPLADDTVYEDTFMKQMQCILDSQDTVILNDIKPMVMAEINKVLQLDEYGNQYNSDEDGNYDTRVSMNDTFKSCFSAQDISNCEPDRFDALQEPQSKSLRQDDSSSIDDGMYFSDPELPPKPEKVAQEERRKRSMENTRSQDISIENQASIPTFPDNRESLSDDDDLFAEWDKQYHTAVDYNLIEQSDISKSEPIMDIPILNEDKKPYIKAEVIAEQLFPEKTVACGNNPTTENLDIQESILKVSNNSHTIDVLTKLEQNDSADATKKPLKRSTDKRKDVSKSQLKETKTKENTGVIIKKEPQTQDKTNVENSKVNSVKSETSAKSSSVQTMRKKGTVEGTSHQKEKRRRSESTSESAKSVLNKNIIINVNDCPSKSSDKCEGRSKSVFNLFFSKQDPKDKSLDEEKQPESMTDKYIKRKTTVDIKDEHKKSKPKISHSKTSTKESTVSSSQSTKLESKVKLQPIDIFGQATRKTPTHAAHRNAAIVSPESTKPEPAPCKPSPLCAKKKVRRTIATQTVSKCTERYTQTKECLKKVVGCQTNPVVIEENKFRFCKTDSVMERMKKMDIAIHQLLQERAKLYDSVGNEELALDKTAEINENVCETIDDIDDGVLDNFAAMSEEEELQVIALQEIDDPKPLDGPSHDTGTKKGKKQSKKVSFSSIDEVTSTNDFTEAKAIKKRHHTPKIVLKLNKSPVKSSSCDSSDEYQVVKKETMSLQNLLDTPSTSKAKMPLKSPAMRQIKSGSKNQEEIKHKKFKKSQLKIYKNIPKKKRLEKLLRKNNIKECSVVLQRIVVFSSSLLSKLATTSHHMDHTKPKIFKSATHENYLEIETSSEESESQDDEALSMNEEDIAQKNKETVKSPKKEENVDMNEGCEDISGIDLHVDMMDVSEDIVIDDNLDVDKTVECEDVVNNGSVSSCEEPVSQDLEPAERCRMYDFSNDGELDADSITVTGHGDAIIAIECVNNNFLAASLDGSVYYFNGRDGSLLSTLRGSNLPVTCISIVSERHGTTVYTGSLDSRIRYYHLETGMEKGPECNVLSAIQSMDRAWDTIFVGTRTGFVLQFECKNNMLIPVSSVKFSDQAILALRALKEGPRKVLLVASRSENVTIKDAQSGLLLRTLEGPKMTVYSLLFEDGKVFCGTSSHHIQVFEYASGSSVGVHAGGKGAVCLRAAAGLLFAGCYDGCVYVYRGGEEAPLAQLRGPSNMLLSLAVIESKVIAGYKDRSLFIWKIPASILNEMVY